MINPDDEAALRLMVFKDALLAITVRERRDGWDDSHVTPVGYIAEARAVADAVVAEAQRLRAQRKPRPCDGHWTEAGVAMHCSKEAGHPDKCA
jgi:hypothetical protein